MARKKKKLKKKTNYFFFYSFFKEMKLESCLCNQTCPWNMIFFSFFGEVLHFCCPRERKRAEKTCLQLCS